MLPIVLVLFVATSALAGPSVLVNQVAIQETSVPYDTGKGMNGGLAAQLFETVEGGDKSIFSLTLELAIQDLASLSDSYSQALALSQAIAMLGEIGNGIPGNACAAANAINQYVRVGGGQSYLATLQRNIDTIVTLINDPSSIRYATSPSGNCNGGGRTYQFEAAWTKILKNASPYNIALLNEEYCAAKRLYQSFNVRSNNIAAAATAASIEPVVQIVRRNLYQLVNFMRAVVRGNGASAAASAKQALSA